VLVIKSKKIKLAGHVARMWRGRGVYRVWRGNLRKRDHWGYLGVDERIILIWIF
jgi:hypothetical protein